MTGKVHVAVIYTDAGGGHRTSALALRQCLEAAGRYRVTLINPYKALIPHLDLFARLGRRSGEDVYNELILRDGRTGIACWAFYGALRLNYLGFERPSIRILADHFRDIRPDIAISVMPLGNRVMLEALARYGATLGPGLAPAGAVMITDWTELAPGVWFPNRDDYHAICGTEDAAVCARRVARLGPRIQRLGGLLIRPEFAAAAQRPAAKADIGLDPDRPLVTLLYGAQGSRRMVELAYEMAEAPRDAQVVFLCGRNTAIADSLRSVAWPFPATVLGFTDRVAEYLSASDLFIGKPGPGSTSEAMALGVPMLLDRSFALPQEAAVLRYVRENGRGSGFATLAEFRAAFASALSRPRRAAGFVPNTSACDIVAVTDRIAVSRRVIRARAAAPGDALAGQDAPGRAKAMTRTNMPFRPEVGSDGRARLTFRIIHNLRAAQNRDARFRAVLLRLSSAGHSYHILETARAGDAAHFARETTRADADILVVAGGDGTINDALQGIGSATPPLGLIPLGTANVLAHEIGIGTDPARIADCLMAGRVAPVRPGLVNGHRFMMMAGIGLDARVVSEVRRTVKRRFGKAAYLFQVVHTLRRWPCPTLHVVADGMPGTVSTMIVSRGSRYGGRFILAPKVSLASPAFQLTLFPEGSALSVFARFLAIPPRLLLRLRLACQIAVRHIDVTGPEGEPVQADGDIVARVPATFTLCDDPIYLCMPSGKD